MILSDIDHVEPMLARARDRIARVQPEDLASFSAAGGLVVDIRPAAQREYEGELPGALVVERNVLEWRLDPTGDHRLAEAKGFGVPVVVVCSEGYASSFAASSLAELGYEHASDLEGGYKAWAALRATGHPTDLGA